jgi:hypothetical protein
MYTADLLYYKMQKSRKSDCKVGLASNATHKSAAVHLNSVASILLRPVSPTQSKVATEPSSPVLPRRARDAWPLESA